MSNLSAIQLAAFASGQPVRQTWSIVGVYFRIAASVTYQTTVIDDGIFAGPGSLQRVVNAGTREHVVLNPHPMDSGKQSAVRYAIEVANGDKFFHRRVGSVWSPGLYNADPRECRLLHSIAVWIPDPVSPYWSAIPHMDFVGQVIDVYYGGGGTKAVPSSSTDSATTVSNTATIVSEQMGADTVLRRIFRAEDADIERVTDTTQGDVGYTF